MPTAFNTSSLVHYKPITFPLLFAVILVDKGTVKVSECPACVLRVSVSLTALLRVLTECGMG
jgi:hypothetical protein